MKTVPRQIEPIDREAIAHFCGATSTVDFAGWPKRHCEYEIQLLVKIVAKDGNLLLGVGPDGRGEFDPTVYQRLDEMGQWLGSSGEAIYETVPIEPFQDGKIAYTAKGDHTLYAITCLIKTKRSCLLNSRSGPP